jgi:hypothetical protein
MSALLNVKQFVRFDEHGNLHVPNKLFVACQAYVQTPMLNDNSSRVATTEWVRAQIVSLTGVTLSETDPIWVFEKNLYYTKVQGDARYLQSFTETDPTVSAWAKASVKPTYTFAELLSKPTTIAGYGITDIPTTLPASDVYAWAKAAIKPSYAYSEITGLPALFSGSYTDLTNKPTLFSGAYADLTGKPTLFSGSYTDLTNKPTIPTYTLSGLGGQPLDADLTAIAALAGTAGFLKKTAADTWALDNNTYLTSYTETDPIWTAEKANYALKTYVDTSISNLVASAPATLNTLNELALALGSDANFATTVATNIGNRVPYTGATANVDLGIYALAGHSFNARGQGTSGGVIALKQNGQVFAATGSAYIGSESAGKLNIYFGDAGLEAAILDNSLLTADRTYNLPNASGTLALTSNIPSITGLVPYTGATGSLFLGSNDVESRFVMIEGDGTKGGILSFKQYATSWTSTTNHTNIYATDTDKLNFNFYQVGGGKSFTFNVSGLTAGANRTYTMPDANGTLALTSNLSAYVPTTRTITINGTAYNLNEDRAWTITTASTYTLPNASNSVLGGIKVGSNLSIDANGVLSSTDTNTWNANTKDVAGYVSAPGAVANKVWKTDGSGNPAWRDDADTIVTSLAWTSITSRPTALSQFTNDLGNYGSWITSSGTAAAVSQTVAANVEGNLVYGNMADNDQFRIRIGGASNAGWVELATADDGTEPIYVRQYTGVFTTVARTATLLDGSGNTSFPGSVTANNFIGYLTGNISGSADSATYGRYVYDSGIHSGSVGYKEPAALHVKYAIDSLRTTYAEIGFYVRNYTSTGARNNEMTFYWSGQAGQPTWLWGSNNGTDIYVWNPANFSVNYATTAGSATDATKLPLAGGALTGNLTITGTTNAPLTLRAVEPYMDVVATGGSNTAGVALYPTAGYDAAIGNFNGGSLNLVAAGYTIAKVTRSSGVIFYVGTTGPIQALGNNTSAYHTFVNSASDNKSWDISLYGNDWILNESNVLPRLKVLAGGGVYADSFFEFSDKRFKQVVKENPGFVGIESITAKHYIKEGKEEIGYFAQDFEGVLDSAILKDKDGVLSLSYRQVHTAKIAALEKRIAELEAKLK